MPFLLWMLLEIAVFIWVGETIGLAWTLLLVVLSTLLGVAILRSQSFTVMKKMQEAIRQGKPPVSLNPNVSAMMLAGMLLIIPGFITDLLGIVILIPALIRYFSSNNGDNNKPGNDQKTIEAEYWEEDNGDNDKKS